MKFKFFVIIISILLIGVTVSHGQSFRSANPEVPRITAFEAMELYSQGKLILANAHERASYLIAHIIGSISLPNGEVQNRNIKLPTNFIVAFYCT
jgi:hypothetical protein